MNSLEVPQNRKNGSDGGGTLTTVEAAKDEVIEAELIREGIQRPVAEKAVRVMHRVRSQFHSGPLPAPETFAGYEEVCPGAAQTILDMAVKQQSHSHDMNRQALRSEVFYRNFGISAATLIVVAMICGSVVCALYGEREVAIALSSVAGLATLAGVFIRGRGLFEKSKTAPPPPAPPTKARGSRSQKQR